MNTKLCFGAFFVGCFTAASTPSLDAVTLQRLGSYESGIFDESATEIPAFDPSTKRAFVTNAFNNTVDVIDCSDPTAPIKIGEISFEIDGKTYSPNSVAASQGTIAVAL